MAEGWLASEARDLRPPHFAKRWVTRTYCAAATGWLSFRVHGRRREGSSVASRRRRTRAEVQGGTARELLTREFLDSQEREREIEKEREGGCREIDCTACNKQSLDHAPYLLVVE